MSSNFNLFSLFGCTLRIKCSLFFLIYIKSNHTVFTVKQQMMTYYCYAKTLAGELNPDLKANRNGHPSMLFNPDLN